MPTRHAGRVSRQEVRSRAQAAATAFSRPRKCEPGHRPGHAFPPKHNHRSVEVDRLSEGVSVHMAHGEDCVVNRSVRSSRFSPAPQSPAVLDVTVVLLEAGYASTAVGPIEVFHSAGVLWNRL